MQKLILMVSALVLSTYSFAVTVSDISASTQQAFVNNVGHSQKPLNMIYGGKDISRPNIAISDESISSIQPRLVG